MPNFSSAFLNPSTTIFNQFLTALPPLTPTGSTPICMASSTAYANNSSSIWCGGVLAASTLRTAALPTRASKESSVLFAQFLTVLTNALYWPSLKKLRKPICTPTSWSNTPRPSPLAMLLANSTALPSCTKPLASDGIKPSYLDLPTPFNFGCLSRKS